MAGLDLSAERSGKTSDTFYPVISKMGKGIKTKRKAKLAAKLLVIAWTIMKKREPFDFSYFTQD